MRKRFTVQFTSQYGIPACKSISRDKLEIDKDIDSALSNPNSYTVDVYDNHNKKDIGTAYAGNRKQVEQLFKAADIIGANKNVIDFNRAETHNLLDKICT